MISASAVITKRPSVRNITIYFLLDIACPGCSLHSAPQMSVGLNILPVDPPTLLPWQSTIYGAIVMGWGTTLLLIGRFAFRRNDLELMKTLICGLTVWLIVEAAFSIYFKVWFNVGVDIAVLALYTLRKGQYQARNGATESNVMYCSAASNDADRPPLDSNRLPPTAVTDGQA